MRGRKSADTLDINEVTRFESCRQTREGKARIPDELWAAAVEVARRDGVNRTAAALHLDGGGLKRRMMATGSVPDKTMPPAFVQMMVPQAVGGSECTIELEGRNGKLRIHRKGATAADLAGLSRALWDAAAQYDESCMAEKDSLRPCEDGTRKSRENGFRMKQDLKGYFARHANR